MAMGAPNGSASITAEPTHLPGTHSVFHAVQVPVFLLSHLPSLSCRQLQEHMERVWQLLAADADAGLCNVPSLPGLLLLSASLAA